MLAIGHDQHKSKAASLRVKAIKLLIRNCWLGGWILQSLEMFGAAKETASYFLSEIAFEFGNF